MRYWSLAGQVSYGRARELQLELLESRSRDEIPDTVLFLEHEAVVTRGRGLQRPKAGGENPTNRHAPVDEGLLSRKGIAFSESERGGDLTYHGPGQLVIYPIVKLDGRGFGADHDVEGHLRKMERVLFNVLSPFGLKAESKADATGVWVGPRKVASLGIAVRKWVTYHGMAVNVVNDLQPFHLISPCGFSPEVMGRLQDLSPELPKAWERVGWRSWLEQEFQREMVTLGGGPGALESVRI